MAVNTAYAGRTYPPSGPYEITEQRVRQFARAVQASDADSPAPTFPVIIAQLTEAQYVQDPEAGIDFSRVVHADERFVHHRPLAVGDVVTATLTVESITERAGLSLVTTKVDLLDAGGALTTEVISTLAVRGEENS